MSLLVPSSFLFFPCFSLLFELVTELIRHLFVPVFFKIVPPRAKCKGQRGRLYTTARLYLCDYTPCLSTPRKRPCGGAWRGGASRWNPAWARCTGPETALIVLAIHKAGGIIKQGPYPLVFHYIRLDDELQFICRNRENDDCQNQR